MMEAAEPRGPRSFLAPARSEVRTLRGSEQLDLACDPSSIRPGVRRLDAKQAQAQCDTLRDLIDGPGDNPEILRNALRIVRSLSAASEMGLSAADSRRYGPAGNVVVGGTFCYRGRLPRTMATVPARKISAEPATPQSISGAPTTCGPGGGGGGPIFGGGGGGGAGAASANEAPA